jgi:hypothetical protein
MAGTIGSEGRAHGEMASTRDRSRIHQRQCEQCHRWFWAWQADRYHCFVCEPLPPSELRAVLDGIKDCAG